MVVIARFIPPEDFTTKKTACTDVNTTERRLLNYSCRFKPTFMIFQEHCAM